MGVNAQTSVPAFTAGQILTAAQVTQINTGIPVFATTTTRDAAFGGTGEKTLAQGQYAYIEATSTLMVYSGSSWINAVSSGMTLISSTTIGSAVASVTVTGAFSSTYENYKIVVSGGVASVNSTLNLTLGATVTGYYLAGLIINYNSSTLNGDVAQNTSSWLNAARTSVNSLNGNIELFSPNLAKNTHVQYVASRSDTTAPVSSYAGYLANTTQYTDFVLTVNSGTITGGTIRVYGYANS